MQRAVVWRSCTRTLSRAQVGVKSRERDREAGESGSIAAAVEMRLQNLGDGRRFQRCPGSGRRRHSTGGADCEAGMIPNEQCGHQGNTSPECPQMTTASAHQLELTRKSSAISLDRHRLKPVLPLQLNRTENFPKHTDYGLCNFSQYLSASGSTGFSL